MQRRSICRRRASRSRRWQDLRPDAGLAFRQSPRIVRYPQIESESRNRRPGRVARIRARNPDPDFRSRRSQGADGEETYMQAVNRLRKRRSMSVPRRATLTAPIVRLTTSRGITATRCAVAQDHLRRDAAALQRHADRRVRVAHRGAAADQSNMQAIDAQRDFWLASVDLGVAVTGGGVTGCAASGSDIRGAAVRRRSAVIEQRIITMLSRRNFIGTSAAVLASASAVTGRAQAAAHSGSADHEYQHHAAAAACRRAGRIISRSPRSMAGPCHGA